MTISKTHRLWPITIFSRRNTVAEQIAHIIGEIDEVALECELLGEAHNLDDLLPLLREFGDIQASIETLFDICDRLRGHGWSERNIRAWIEKKNRDRSYYQDQVQP